MEKEAVTSAEKLPRTLQAAPKDVTFPGPRRNVRNTKKVRFLIISVILLSLVGLGVWFIFSEPNLGQDSSFTPTPSSEITLTPTQVEINRSNVRVQILNGTGIAGAASSLQEKLKGLGYSNFKVGNAKSYDFKVTEVTFNSSLAGNVKDEIEAELKEIYQDVEVSTKDLGDIDIEIITGYPKGYAPTPTQKPKASVTPTISGSITSSPSPTTTTSPTPTP